MNCEKCGHELFDPKRCWACGAEDGETPKPVIANHDHKRPGRIRITISPPGEIEATISVTIKDAKAIKNALSKLLSD